MWLQIMRVAEVGYGGCLEVGEKWGVEWARRQGWKGGEIFLEGLFSKEDAKLNDRLWCGCCLNAPLLLHEKFKDP